MPSTATPLHTHSLQNPKKLISSASAFASASAAQTLKLKKIAPFSCCICKCSINNNGGICGGARSPLRAWVVLKESKCLHGSFRGGEFPAVTVSGVSKGNNVENENMLEEKQVRVQRRGGRAVVEDLNLLTIPGVGPRNLRKLVEKGFEGVAQLKQLYREKRIANETLELRDLVEIVPEPIDKWQNVGPDHFNKLDAFHADQRDMRIPFKTMYLLPESCRIRSRLVVLSPSGW
ncbi:dNK domain-containing protein [Abeliophyllum distichum]|uniref:DNK domain-containing protein n=1 Tax=Abeliophyllum distichum TaxID=126358 RepID=A0ABD1SUS3_9LAMI